MAKAPDPQKVKLDKLPMEKAVLKNKHTYEKRLKELQFDMLRIQQAYYHHKRRAIMVFEGWDAGGKGGAIRRITEPLDPRGVHVWPIGRPDPIDQGKHYLYRFWTRLPEPGTIAIFDRSWYGRVMVEFIEGLIDKETRDRAYEEINDFERTLADNGVRLVKFFFHITPEEQLKRFRERLTNPYKRWKLTEEDIRNREKWDEYVKAAERMFQRTSTKAAPWQIIPANKKWYARVHCLEIATQELKKGVDIETPILDPEIQRMAAQQLGIELDKESN
jgi:polyphosphate kinase 2 (PPK2 family)